MVVRPGEPIEWKNIDLLIFNGSNDPPALNEK